MINKVLLILLYFNFVQTQNSDDLPFFDFTNVIKELANIAILQSLNLSSNLNISEDCKKILFESYNGKNKDLYNSIIIYDSSKSNNDLAIYSDCLNGNIEYPNVNKESIKNETTFIVFFFNEKQENISFTNLTKDLEYIIIGLCIPKGCEEQEYSAIFHEISSEISLLNDYVETYVFDLRKDDNENRIIKCIPLFIIIFIFFFSIFKWIPCFIFTFFFKLNNEKEIQKCFLITDNMDEILSQNYSGKNLATNDMGLFAIRGIRSITIILLLFGKSFQHIYHLPVKIISIDEFVDLLRNELFTFVQFGDRFGTRLLYGLSGFILSFKMLYYLDNEVEKKDDIINENKDEEDIINESEEEDNNNKILDNMLDKPLTSLFNDSQIPFEEKKSESKTKCNDINSINNIKQGRITINITAYENYKNKLTYDILYKFIFRQSYKYFMFVIAVLFFKFSLINEFYLFFQDGSPMWAYCQEEILDKFSIKQILGNLFLFSPYSENTFFSYNPFDIVYNEIFFFIIGSILIFYSFKNTLRLDIIILVLFVFLETLKFIIYHLLHKKNPNERFYPIMFYQDQPYAFILYNPFYNMPSMLIGLLFGMVNYCIQNNAKANENIKTFLKIPKLILSFVKKEGCFKYILLISFSILLFGSSLLFTIILNYFFEFDDTNKIQQIDNFFTSYSANLISLYDTDIGIIATFFLLIQIVLLGSSYIMGFFSHQYWGIISRPYFTCILLTDLLSFLVFYQSENRIKLELFNVFFFSFEIFIVLIFLQVIIFVLIEIPLKKLNKLIVDPQITNKKRKKNK
jgi:hypothetical protein